MKLFNLRRALHWSVVAAATLTGFLVCNPLASAQMDSTAGLTTLVMAKTHDQSCDVLDSRARTAFRNAVWAWVRSTNADEAAKTRMWKYWDGISADSSHDCASNAFLSAILWTFRDSRGEDPQGQFRLLMKAKSYELKCHALPHAGLQAFYQAGLDWIQKSVANSGDRSTMTAEWQKSTGSMDADCEKDSMLDFFATWTFQAASAGNR